MKKTMIAGGVAALALMGVVGGVAVAQQAPAPTEARQARGDADGDGRISQAEFVQQRVARLTTADANGDGSVSAEESAAGREAMKAQRASSRFDRMDANSDGSISRAEFDAQTAARAERGPRADKGPRGGQRAERMAARREARGPVVIAESQTKATESFARLDADSDGYVTVEERRAGREQMRESRQERRAERMARRGAQTASPAGPASE